MPVISVEVNDELANKIQPHTVVKSEDFERMLEDQYKTVVDFGEGIKVSEVLDFLKNES